MATDSLYWMEWRAGSTTLGMELWEPSATPLGATPTRIEIPAEASFTVTGGKLAMKYEKKRPFGLPLTPEVKLKFDLLALTGDLADLRIWLMQPTASVGTLATGGGETRSFTTSTTMRLYRYDAEGNQQTLFVGAQRVRPARRGKLRNVLTTVASCEYEVPFLHLARLAIEEITPADLVNNCFYSSSAQIYDRLYDLLVENGTTVLAVVYERVGYKIAMFAYDTIWSVLRDMAESVYRAYMRDSTVTFKFQTASAATYGRPRNHWTLNRQNYLLDGAPGTSIDSGGGLLGAWVPGVVYKADQPITDRDYWLEGSFVDDGKGDSSRSLYRFRSAWDFVKIELAQWKVKGQIRTVGLNTVLAMTKVYDNTWTASHDIPHTLAFEDLAAGDVEFETAASAITESKAIVAGLDGDDITESSYRARGTENESGDFPIRLLFHNVPHIGPSRSATFRYGATMGGLSGGSKPIPDISSGLSHSAIQVNTLSPFGLYYNERPSPSGTYLTTDQVMIRVHSECSIDDGIATVFNYGERIPSPGWPTTIVPSIWQAWWSDLLVLLWLLQRDSAFPYAVTRAAMQTYGHPSTTTWEKLPFDLEKVQPDLLGEFWTIGSGAAAGWVNGEDLGFLYTSDLHLVEAELDLDTAIVTTTFTYLPRSYYNAG